MTRFLRFLEEAEERALLAAAPRQDISGRRDGS